MGLPKSARIRLIYLPSELQEPAGTYVVFVSMIYI